MSQIFQFSFPTDKFFDFLENTALKTKISMFFQKMRLKGQIRRRYYSFLRRIKKILFFIQIFLFRKRYDI